ncbi:MAG: ribbon-helix-helix domain-containing protein, partial [bacterium]|nr:ribbon-helix-helix domain-containing protein [bacterium]
EQSEQLKTLHKKTKVPVAEYIRQGIDLILDQHRDKLANQLELYSSHSLRTKD